MRTARLTYDDFGILVAFLLDGKDMGGNRYKSQRGADKAIERWKAGQPPRARRFSGKQGFERPAKEGL